MYTAIEKIQAAFQKADLKHSIDQMGENWILRAGVNGNASTYQFLFISDKDNSNDVFVRIFQYAKFPPEAMARGYRILNELQVKYRYVRFVLNDNGNVNVEYDFPIAFENIGNGAVETLIRLTKILDECYPVVMRAIWN